MDSTVVVIADVTAKPEHAEQLGAALEELAAACRTEPGCRAYDLFRSTEQPERFLSVEKYTDAAAFEAHRAAEHFTRIGLGTVVPLVETRDVQLFTGANSVPPKS
ncbi:putative quinol monooxygenase [Nocardia sp. NPDC127579]|uniref:putative quinol monooxygenase n=1 Tax=Nocardia sp. NPDC127579 TaxID=3345402 RepID=UPI00363F1E51